MIGHRLITPLTVWRPVSTTDPGGGQQTDYIEQGQVRGQVSQPSAEERTVAQQAGVNLTHVVHVAYDADVRRGDHLDGDLPSDVGAGRRLRVVSVVSDSRRTYLRIEAETTQPIQ